MSKTVIPQDQELRIIRNTLKAVQDLSMRSRIRVAQYIMNSILEMNENELGPAVAMPMMEEPDAKE